MMVVNYDSSKGPIKYITWKGLKIVSGGKTTQAIDLTLNFTGHHWPGRRGIPLT